MIKRIIHIGKSCYISAKNEQLLLNNKEEDKEESIPIEDIGFLVLDHYQVTITSFAIQRLLEAKVEIVFCDSTHHPAGLCLPVDGGYEQTARIHVQIEASEPLKKNLWKQIITSKIKNQGYVLDKYGFDSQILKKRIENITSGDTTNQEAIASQYYWKNLFGADGFTRERFGDYPNNFLNFTYAIIRAIAARAVVTAGLHPSIGLHHKNKYNTYCLADDIMEPYRAFADSLVYDYYLNYPEDKELDTDKKRGLYQVAYCDAIIGDQTHPLMLAIQHTANSLYACYKGESKNLKLPRLCD